MIFQRSANFVRKSSSYKSEIDFGEVVIHDGCHL